MILNDSIDILIPTIIKDAKGIEHTKYATNRTVSCSFQPLKYNAQYKPYGITDQTSNMILCQDFNITADNHISHNNVEYRIDSILPYSRHVEIYIEKVI